MFRATLPAWIVFWGGPLFRAAQDFYAGGGRAVSPGTGAVDHLVQGYPASPLQLLCDPASASRPAALALLRGGGGDPRATDPAAPAESYRREKPAGETPVTTEE
jgi:hypothetical protein